MDSLQALRSSVIMKNSPLKQRFIDDLGLVRDGPPCQRLKDTLRQLTADIFDVTLNMREQSTQKTEQFNNQLTQAFPDIFNVAAKLRDKRLKTVYLYVKKVFYARRHIHKKQIEEINKAKMHLRLSTRLQGQTQNCTSPGSPRRRRASSFNLAGSSSNACQGSTPPSSCIVMRHVQSSPGPNFASASNEDRGSSPASVDQGEDEIMIVSSISPPPANSLSTIPVASSSNSASPSAGTNSAINAPRSHIQLEEVKNFLASCKPDMQHLLKSFIDFGCNSKEYLASISKRSSIEVEEFLRALVVPNGAYLNGTNVKQGRLTEMDVLVLKWQFKQCGDGRLQQ